MTTHLGTAAGAPERVAYRPMTLMEWEDTQWHI